MSSSRLADFPRAIRTTGSCRPRAKSCIEPQKPGVKSVASAKLANALFVVEISRC